MPTRSEMLEFFKKFRSDRIDADEDAEGEGEADDRKQIAQNAAAVLTQVQQPDGDTPNRPMEVKPPSSPNPNNMRSRLEQIQKSPINKSPTPGAKVMLPPQTPEVSGRITLVLDVDETLVHSSFKPQKRCDLELPIVANGQQGQVYVRFRPFLSEFLNFVSTRFEVVVFTASLGLYCNPLMDYLDPSGKLGPLRLFREHCSKANGAYIKDLSLLGRPLERIAIVDNSPVAYYFQSRNAIPIVSWFEDPDDKELWELLPMLMQLAQCDNVYDVLDPFNAKLIDT